jgi:DNA topoisomerase-2
MPPKKSTKKARTVEEQYQMKSPREHILIRPDSYVGSLEPQEELMWIYNVERDIIVEKKIIYSPGLYKIFDEVLVNAADHKANYPDLVTHFDFTIDVENNLISVKNDGPGIVVVKHEEHDMYVPTMIFGHLLTGSNFDDEEERTTGGRNGYGAKLANIFSTEFEVETVDGENNKKFVQTWTNNMEVAGKPKITTLKSTSPKTYTKITFKPDLARFGMNTITSDMEALFIKRAYDMAGVCGVSVSINGDKKKIKFKSFKEYIGKYQFTAVEEGMTNITTEFSSVQYFDSERWQVGVVYAPDQSFKHISFVNSICTYHGGKHVDHVVDKLVDNIKEAITKKQKKMTIKPATIKEHLIVFVNSIIVNPAFTSQVKENLKTPVSKFGSKCDLTDKFLKSIQKLGIVTHVIDNISQKDQNKMSKGSSKGSKSINKITKAVDAPKAGTTQSENCWLILTEGDSAKALAMEGLKVINRDYYGVFALKGKLLNARETSASVLSKNEEICNIIKLLGLQIGKKYTSVKELRYGHIIIMTDQDYDGFHIQGLVINFIHYFWPELLNIKGFICQFITPIVKATKGKQTISFFSVKDYYDWKETKVGDWYIKYYKGLGTSNNVEAREYFSDLDNLIKEYYSKPIDDYDKIEIDDKKTIEANKKKKTSKKVIEDLNTATIVKKYKNPTREAITLAFEKERTDDRKIWVKSDVKDEPDHTIKTKSYDDFINNEMVLFSKDDCERSISCIDGLKISQRKILHTVLKRKIFTKRKEQRVAQLAAFTSSDTKYHHGESSLVGAIKKMCMDFTGANNLNLLVPSGQFGTRYKNGADAASERYIHTYLEPISLFLIKDIDSDVLDYVNDDGVIVEPKFFAPIIPLILINGSSGIGTGFSSDVPKYKTSDVIDMTRSRIKSEEINTDIVPYYKGFTGTILKSNEEGKYLVYGKYSVVNETTVKITEIPVGAKSAKSPEDYILFLEKLVTEKKIEDFEKDIVSDPPIFHVTFDESVLDNLRAKKEIYKYLNLVTTISTENMNLYDHRGNLKHYYNIGEIINDFYEMRYEIYDKRKQFLTDKYTVEADMLRWKMKFINDVINETIIIFRQKDATITARLEELNYPKLAKIKTLRNDNDDEEDNNASYSYLKEMKWQVFTEEKIAELQKQLDDKEEELRNIINTTIEEQWLKEIDEFEVAHEEWLEVKRNEAEIEQAKNMKKAKKVTKKVTKRVTKK